MSLFKKNKKKSKKLEKVCGNCRLFDPSKEECSVTLFIAGEKMHMPVSPKDSCHMEELGIEVQQMRWWCEDPVTGKQSNKGVVKIQYPESWLPSGTEIIPPTIDEPIND